MELSEAEARRRFAASSRAILATVRPDGRPHLVPIVFALVESVVYSAVDHKPKATRGLQRLTNLEHDPRCTLLVDGYDDDWSQLWWVRADCDGEVQDAGDIDDAGRAALTERYPAYRHQPPAGPYLRLEVVRWRGWVATPSNG